MTPFIPDTLHNAIGVETAALAVEQLSARRSRRLEVDTSGAGASHGAAALRRTFWQVQQAESRHSSHRTDAAAFDGGERDFDRIALRNVVRRTKCVAAVGLNSNERKKYIQRRSVVIKLFMLFSQGLQCRRFERRRGFSHGEEPRLA